MKDFLQYAYRMIFWRGGYGVHSPFVFDLITTVIEEHSPYYCYEQLCPIRLQIQQIPHQVTINNQAMSVKKAMDRYCFTEQEDQLLFRLANRFQPKTIYVEGSDFGLVPLYITAYSTATTCFVVEQFPSVCAIAQEYIKKYATASVVLHNSCATLRDTLEFLPNAFAHSQTMFDFIVLGFSDRLITIQSFKQFLPYVNANSVMVIAGINSSVENRKMWHTICTHPKVTVTIDLVRLGVVFFNPALHQKTYKNIL